MAHYSFINQQNIVIEVIVGKDEDDLDSLPEGFESWEDYYLTKRPNAVQCKRTSYNTKENLHSLGGTAFRGNYAGIGYEYDPESDLFYPPQPFESWTKDSTNAKWIPPIPCPDPEMYVWDEDAYQLDNDNGWIEMGSQ
jgi:hypothetical protein